jgi:misacylated tRNA(Ala) deacylase
MIRLIFHFTFFKPNSSLRFTSAFPSPLIFSSLPKQLMSSIVLPNQLICQQNPTLKEFLTTVIHCQKGKNSHWIVSSADTVFFPEGGGQPADHGVFILPDGHNVEVVDVQRNHTNGLIEHTVTEPIEVGISVVGRVNWPRRIDHMTHHTAQHLISAYSKSLFGWDTKSWWLGSVECNVEFSPTDERVVTDGRLQNIEMLCNEAIANNHAVTIHLAENNSQMKTEENEEVPHTNELNEKNNVQMRMSKHTKVHGAKRLIEIEGIDMNACCGTHVAHLSLLQMVKITNWEKARGGFRVFFIAADRITKEFSEKLKREREMSSLLSCGAEQFVPTVHSLQQNLKLHVKEKKDLLNELVLLEAHRLSTSPPIHLTPTGMKILHHHRENGDLTYMQLLNTHLRDPKVTNLDSKMTIVFLTIGDKNGEGMFFISAEPQILNAKKVAITTTLNAKGGGKGSTLQGKAQSLKRLNEIWCLFD